MIIYKSMDQTSCDTSKSAPCGLRHVCRNPHNVALKHPPSTSCTSKHAHNVDGISSDIIQVHNRTHKITYIQQHQWVKNTNIYYVDPITHKSK
jgi:hypothetical protein